MLPLALILVVQAVLSARLLHTSGSPPAMRRCYIYTGHQLIYELFHGGGSPYYED